MTNKSIPNNGRKTAAPARSRRTNTSPEKKKSAATAKPHKVLPPSLPKTPPDTTDNEGTPLYRVVLHELRERIRTGVYVVGARLPTENELSESFEVSRHTIREALRQLRQDGLIASRQGAGSTVRRQGGLEPYVHEVGSIEDLNTYASKTEYHAESSEIISADSAIAERLDSPLNQRWLRIEGLRFAPGNDKPLGWTEVFVHNSYAGVGLLLGRRPGPIYSWIEETYGERIAEVEQRITAGLVPATLVEALQVEPGSPVVEIRRTFRLASGTVAEISFNVYPATHFSYSMTMRKANNDRKEE